MRFWDELEKEPHGDTRDVLTLLLATGARKSNVYEMAWADISIPLATWRVPMSKSGEGYDVNLTQAALDVLERRRREMDPGEKFIFPANSASGHITDIKKRWGAFRKRAGLPGVRLHDLRRTKGSMAAIAGESLQKIGAMLGHGGDDAAGEGAIEAGTTQTEITETSQGGQWLSMTSCFTSHSENGLRGWKPLSWGSRHWRNWNRKIRRVMV